VGLANLGSESETCVGSCVHLVGVSISFEKIFYRLPFTPPSLVRRIGPSTVALMLVILVPSVHLTVSFIFHLLNLACGILASLGPRNVYKDMLNNMVSPIDLVVMNLQNQTRTNGKWGHVRYNLRLFGDL
jgi:hypothetical protein